MSWRERSPLSLSAERPSRASGVIVATASVAAATALIYPLKHIAPVLSLGVVYLLAVVVVATFWGLALGIATGILSAAAFNFFHLPPVGRLTLAHGRDWVALAAFLVIAVATGLVAELARVRAGEAELRRQEADLSAELARQLLGAEHLQDALPVAAQRLGAALGVASAAIELREVEASERTVAFPLESAGTRIGTLLLPSGLPASERARVRERIVPSLSSILGAARHRAELQSEVVETAALRRADTVKTALLRAVSHDLRSPLTAIATAGEAIASPAVSPEEHDELAAVIQEEAQRLSRLVDNLLDLSRLEAGAAEPHRDSASVEELIRAALRELAANDDDFSLSIDSDLPPVRVDSIQMERALVNVLENARRYSGGHPVSVRARAVRSLAPPVGRAVAPDVGERNAGERRTAGDRVIVRVVDRGPGIPVGQLERIFEPFYRSPGGAGGHHGSGLGLAIARGFAEANAGSLHVESLPGQGATFVFELPIPEPGGGHADGEPPLAAHPQDGERERLPAPGARGRES